MLEEKKIKHIAIRKIDVMILEHIKALEKSVIILSISQLIFWGLLIFYSFG